jgi:hypothetical protein
VLAQLAEERPDVLGTGVGDVGQKPEVQPSLLRSVLIATALIPDIRSSCSQLLGIGVWPCGEELQRTVGEGRSPLSYRNDQVGLASTCPPCNQWSN